MMRSNEYYVYIKTDNTHSQFEAGITANILEKLLEQRAAYRAYIKNKKTLSAPGSGWKLVYYEHGLTLSSAESRRQRLLKFPPSKRNALIERHNPCWYDLGTEWLK